MKVGNGGSLKHSASPLEPARELVSEWGCFLLFRSHGLHIFHTKTFSVWNKGIILVMFGATSDMEFYLSLQQLLAQLSELFLRSCFKKDAAQNHFSFQAGLILSCRTSEKHDRSMFFCAILYKTTNTALC